MDFDQPVGLMLLGVVNHVMDDEEAYANVARLVSALAPGSMVVRYCHCPTPRRRSTARLVG